MTRRYLVVLQLAAILRSTSADPIGAENEAVMVDDILYDGRPLTFCKSASENLTRAAAAFCEFHQIRDARCRELTPGEATALAEHWIDLAAAAPSSRATTTLLLPRAGSECAALDPRWSGPPAQTRVSSERWYGHVKCIGAHEGEPVLTFTCDGAQLRDFRDGAVPANAPSEAYADVIRRGLVEMGASPEEARRYVEARTNAPLVREKESTA